LPFVPLFVGPLTEFIRRLEHEPIAVLAQIKLEALWWRFVLRHDEQ
jgi:hypothetical protein